jgi:tight adherence protein B
MTVALVAAASTAVVVLLLRPRVARVDHRPKVSLLPAIVALALGPFVPGAIPHAALALVAVPAVLAGQALRRRHAHARSAAENADRVVEVCDLLAAELAAGRTPEAALDETAVVWSPMRVVADACRLGGDVPEAMRELSTTPGAGSLRLLGAAWAVSHRTGAGLRGGTRRVADAVRSEQATRRTVAGELASARATARLMAGLPVLALLMGSGAGGDPWPFLLGSPWGLGCLAAGLGLGFAGLWWIELIAGEVER